MRGDEWSTVTYGNLDRAFSTLSLSPLDLDDPSGKGSEVAST